MQPDRIVPAYKARRRERTRRSAIDRIDECFRAAVGGPGRARAELRQPLPEAMPPPLSREQVLELIREQQLLLLQSLLARGCEAA